MSADLICFGCWARVALRVRVKGQEQEFRGRDSEVRFRV